MTGLLTLVFFLAVFSLMKVFSVPGSRWDISWRAIAWLRAGTTLAFGQSQNTSVSSSVAAHCPGEMFFGHSEDAQESLGWLICLDEVSQTGAIYEPPGMLKLQIKAWSEQGALQFKSRPFADGDTYYVFDGKAYTGTLSGKLERIQGTSSKTEKTYQVTATRLGQCQLTGSCTRFSNIEYVDQAGELVGAEAILLRNSNACEGIVTFYGNYWGLSTYYPLLLTNVSQTAPQTIGFVLHSRLTSRAFSIKMSPSGAILSPKRLESWESPVDLRLKKMASFLPPARRDIPPAD